MQLARLQGSWHVLGDVSLNDPTCPNMRYVEFLWQRIVVLSWLDILYTAGTWTRESLQQVLRVSMGSTDEASIACIQPRIDYGAN